MTNTTPPKPTIREIEAILMKYLPIASIPTEDWNSVVKELSALLSPQTMREKCKLGHDYGFNKGVDILTGKGRKRHKCIVCGFEEDKLSPQTGEGSFTFKFKNPPTDDELKNIKISTSCGGSIPCKVGCSSHPKQTGEGELDSTTTNYQSVSSKLVVPDTLPEEMEKDFWLMWGLAPKGTLKYGKGMTVLAFLRKHLSMQRERIEKKMGRSIAFCTCGDALLREDDTYYCIGCDKTYVLSVQKGEK